MSCHAHQSLDDLVHGFEELGAQLGALSTVSLGGFAHFLASLAGKPDGFAHLA